METNKVIIMQVEKNFTTAYTSDGQFIKVRRKSWHEVGKVLNLNDLEGTPRKNPFVLKLATTAAIAILFVFLGIFNPFFLQQAEAEAKTYLSLGLNTGSIEVWTDYEDKIIKTSYTNAGSQLATLDIEGKDIYEAITIIITAARKSGLLNEGLDDILLVDIVNLNTDTSYQVQDDKLKNFISAELSDQDYTGVMVMTHHNKEYLEKAQELDLTVSQYHIFEKSTTEGYSLSNEQIKHGHIRKMLTEVGTTPEELFKVNHMQYNEIDKNSGMHEEMHEEAIDNNEPKIDHKQSKDMPQYNSKTRIDDEPSQEHRNETVNHPGSMKMPTDMEQHK